jgi:hypothetical protein
VFVPLTLRRVAAPSRRVIAPLIVLSPLPQRDAIPFRRVSQLLVGVLSTLLHSMIHLLCVGSMSWRESISKGGSLHHKHVLKPGLIKVDPIALRGVT